MLTSVSVDLIDLVLSSQQDKLMLFITAPQFSLLMSWFITSQSRAAALTLNTPARWNREAKCQPGVLIEGVTTLETPRLHCNLEV